MLYEILVMPTIADLHAHFLPERYVAEARRAGIDHPDGMPGWPEWSPEGHLALLDQVGIELAVLSISSPGVHFGDPAAADALARHVNDVAAGLARTWPERFGFFAALPLPDVPAALAEAERALDLGARGVGLLTNHRGQYLSDPALEPLWELLARRAAVVHLHPTSPPGWEQLPAWPRPMVEFPLETARSVIDLVLAGVPDRHGAIRFVVSHCGGALPLVIERAERFSEAFLGDPPQVRATVAGLWFDTAGTPFPEPLPTLVGLVGEERVVYGSDFCFTPSAAVTAQLGSLAGAPPPRSASGWLDLLADNGAALLAAPIRTAVAGS